MKHCKGQGKKMLSKVPQENEYSMCFRVFALFVIGERSLEKEKWFSWLSWFHAHLAWNICLCLGTFTSKQ